MPFFAVSAKSGEDVKGAFEAICRAVLVKVAALPHTTREAALNFRLSEIPLWDGHWAVLGSLPRVLSFRV
jgi:hypothetical protein